MIRIKELDDPRRRILIGFLTAGWILPQSFNAFAASAFGSRPEKLPPGQSIYRIDGTVTVNGTSATLKTRINPGDTVETGPNSEVIFVVGGHSMIVRANSKLTLEGKSGVGEMLIQGLRLLSGKLLSVSRNSPMQVTTTTATIGIRGTGFYAEADPEQTYFCTCYGQTEVSANKNPEIKEVITAKYHDRPVYILAKDGSGKDNIRNAPFINHTDQELALIETLVGRTPPFVFSKDSYSGPRRGY